MQKNGSPGFTPIISTFAKAYTNSIYKVDQGGMEEGAEAHSLCVAQAERLSNDGLRSKLNWY